MFDLLRDWVGYLWGALGIFWLISGLTAKRAAKTQSAGSRLLQVAPVFAAFALIFGRWPRPLWLQLRLFPESFQTPAWIGLGLTVAGIGFAVWARFWLGKNWSGRVTVKEQHELIQNGPYAIVRHPIYSGFLFALLGTALVYGELRVLLALPLVGLGWGLKLRQEEQFMTQQFGSIYLDYKRRVKALVPFVI